MTGRTTPKSARETGVSRRNLLIGSAVSAAALPIAAEGATPGEPAATDGGKTSIDVALEVNGTRRRLSLDPRTTLLETVREHLGLTGSKKGCDHGQCGACTMLLGSRRVLGCLTLAGGSRAGNDHRGAGASRRHAPSDAAGVHRP